MKDAQAVEILIRALGFRHREVQVAAANALAEIGDLRAIDPLVRAAEKIESGPFQSEFRQELLRALQTFMAFSPIETINILGMSGNPYARITAAETLKIAGPILPSAVLSILRTNPVPEVRLAAFQSMSKKFGINEWIEALKDSDLKVREMAAETLGRLKDPRAVKPLIVAVDQCSAAHFALFRIGDARAFEIAIAVLDERTPSLQQAWAIDFLAGLNDLRAAGALIDLLRRYTAGSNASDSRWADLIDPSWSKTLDPDREKHFYRSIDDLGILRALALALAQFKDPRAVSPLIELLDSHTAHRQFCDSSTLSAITGALSQFCDVRALDSLIHCHETWQKWEQQHLPVVIEEIASAHVTTLTNEMLRSLSELKDIIWRQQEDDHWVDDGRRGMKFESGGATIVRDVSFESVRRLAKKELLRRDLG